jgi:5-methylcytosine-specific restriction endonuclease McrA
MTRREFPPKVMQAAFDRAAGRCEGCTVKLYPRKYQYDHRIPDSHGGEPTLDNCQVLCSACHSAKTKGDTTIAAKIKRVRRAYAGIRRSGRPMPGSRASGIRKRMDGTVEKW